jgi:hypothetical protein
MWELPRSRADPIAQIVGPRAQPVPSGAARVNASANAEPATLGHGATLLRLTSNKGICAFVLSALIWIPGWPLVQAKRGHLMAGDAEWHRSHHKLSDSAYKKPISLQ